MGIGVQADDFLAHLFPGASAALGRFREEIERLNLYCRRYKGSVGCVLLTGEPGVGKNYTVRAISAHSQWLTLTEDEKREQGYCDARGKILLPATALVKRLLFKEHREQRNKPTERVPRLATILGPQLTDDLLGSELFGHKKGAFTGAQESHRGIFGDASVDDVFIDEIGDLPLSIQSKLLQVVETRTFRPVGGEAKDEGTSEHRIFLATNQPLEERVRSGRFREDLYWRIQGHRVFIPPLRDRRDVIEELARAMLRSVNQEHRGPERIGPSLDPNRDRYCLLPQGQWEGRQPQWSNWVVVLEEEDLQWMREYDWPGNVRELRQRLELYVYRNGHCRLKEVMPPPPIDLRQGGAGRAGSGGFAAAVEQGVTEYLEAVLRGGEPAPGQPQALLQRFDKLVKRAVCNFRNRRRLTSSELQRIFPLARDWQTTLGKWKSDAAEGGDGDGEDSDQGDIR